jgi:hypothetical protein
MHRLTEPITDTATGKVLGYTILNGYNINLAATQRLGEYEDTGITPEQIIEIDKLYREKCEEVNELTKVLKDAQKEIKAFKNKNRKAPEIGSVIEVAGIQWKILDKTEKGYLAITDDIVETRQFDSSSSNWEESNLREYLNGEFAENIEREIGELPEFERDLISLDGQTEYGKCFDRMSLLTVDEYRKYRKHLPNVSEWWWMITPWSTPCNGYEYSVTIVAPSGLIYCNRCDYDGGVRPFCIFPSSIFESEDN